MTVVGKGRLSAFHYGSLVVSTSAHGGGRIPLAGECQQSGTLNASTEEFTTQTLSPLCAAVRVSGEEEDTRCTSFKKDVKDAVVSQKQQWVVRYFLFRCCFLKFWSGEMLTTVFIFFRKANRGFLLLKYLLVSSWLFLFFLRNDSFGLQHLSQVMLFKSERVTTQSLRGICWMAFLLPEDSGATLRPYIGMRRQSWL